MEKKNNPIPEIKINTSQTLVCTYVRVLYYALAVDDDMTGIRTVYIYTYGYSTPIDFR